MAKTPDSGEMQTLGASSNVLAKVEGDMLYLVINLTGRLGSSTSGKSQIVATTHGFQPIPSHPGIGVSLNINAKR